MCYCGAVAGPADARTSSIVHVNVAAVTITIVVVVKERVKERCQHRWGDDHALIIPAESVKCVSGTYVRVCAALVDICVTEVIITRYVLYQ
jgi:hypothetical protein